MMHPLSKAIGLALMILSISLFIPLSPGDVWFFLNTQSFVVSHHTKPLTVPFKVTYFILKPNPINDYHRLLKTYTLYIQLYIDILLHHFIFTEKICPRHFHR